MQAADDQRRLLAQLRSNEIDLALAIHDAGIRGEHHDLVLLARACRQNALDLADALRRGLRDG